MAENTPKNAKEAEESIRRKAEELERARRRKLIRPVDPKKKED